MTLILNYAARSDMGLVRGNNEDSVYAGPRLLALADGMGGHAAGEVASQIVISTLAVLDNDQPDEDLLEELRSAIDTANELVREEINDNPELAGMGTTLIAMLFDGPRMGMAAIGDSRAYLLRDNELHQITRDDSYVQDLVDIGTITSEEAREHPQRSKITNVVMGSVYTPHLTIREVQAGDRYLICSDGLSDPVTFDTIQDTLRQGSPQDCADRLIDLALRSGGPDNVSVIVADVEEQDFSTSTPILGGAAASGADLDIVTRSDSAAARAAALTAGMDDRTDAGRALPQTIGEDNADATGKDRKTRRATLRLVSIITFLFLTTLAVGAGIVGYTWDNSFYVAANDKQEINIYQGFRNSGLSVLNGRLNAVLCESAIYDAGNEPEDCRRLTLQDFTPAVRSELNSGKVFHTSDEARGYLTRAVGVGLLPICEPPADQQPVTYGPDGLPLPPKKSPTPCRQVK